VAHTDTGRPGDFGRPGWNGGFTGIGARDRRRSGASGQRPTDATPQETLPVEDSAST
jgi:hypothetical protein